MTGYQFKWIRPENDSAKSDKSPFGTSGTTIVARESENKSLGPAQGMPFSPLPLHNTQKKEEKTHHYCGAKSARSPAFVDITATRDVPSACLGPSVCAVIGICGRISCLVGEEHNDFSAEITEARSLDNAHRVPDEFMADDLSTKETA